ncbi:MAG: Gfo/Idh/MocA family oxidoreductase [Clostridiales bacterium]|nr:Gfo/Idh/MocA family oxidoreductase [Clostridiales bacterium]
MTGKIRLGFVGCGAFVQNFIPLFKAHPYVEWVAVTDLIRERRDETAKKHGVTRVYDSFEDMLKDPEINAVGIFTQRQLHGPMTIAALKAGKNVYSAVPMASKVEEIHQIVDLVRETGLTFSMGETGHYRPCSVFCRNKMSSGEMGDFVYGAAQYHHDMRHFYKSYMRSGGADWKKVAGIPPTLYPTHSTGMLLSSIGSYAVKVSGFGFVDHHEDDIFGEGKNLWDNPFSNTTMIMRLKNGGTARANEFRRISWYGPQSYITSIYGTKASYEFSVTEHHYVRLEGMDAVHENVSKLLNPPEMEEHRGEEGFLNGVTNNKWCNTMAPVQNAGRLPAEFIDQRDGHGGTHKFMVDDFCKAAYTGKLSPTNAWVAARYNLPGLVAYQSALRDGEPLEVPDCGEPPANWEWLDLVDYSPEYL